MAEPDTATRFFWGDDQDQACRCGNVPDAAHHAAVPAAAVFACNDGHVLEAPVGSFAPNPWGFHDLTGNMFEWLADSYRPSYATLPRDGRPYDEPNCASRSVRGGSIGYHYLSAFRSADRSDDPPGEAWYGVGFRGGRGGLAAPLRFIAIDLHNTDTLPLRAPNSTYSRRHSA